MNREGELNHITLSVFRLPKGRNINILETVWCVKLKLTGLVVGDTEVTKRKYLHPTDFASTHTTTVTINTSFITTTGH